MLVDDTLYLSPLTTDRLFLRTPEITDANEIAALRSDPEINKYLNRPANTSIDEAYDFILQLQHGIKSNECYYWVLTLKNENKLIGIVCLWNIDRKNGSIELGYELRTGHQGKGLMQEGLAKIIEIAFQHLGYKKLNAFTHPENIKSIKLLEKNGFIRYASPETNTAVEEADLYFCLVNPSAF
jgi:ribosomal-protein-alanine N-acetyltransferase